MGQNISEGKLILNKDFKVFDQCFFSGPISLFHNVQHLMEILTQFEQNCTNNEMTLYSTHAYMGALNYLALISEQFSRRACYGEQRSFNITFTKDTFGLLLALKKMHICNFQRSRVESLQCKITRVSTKTEEEHAFNTYKLTTRFSRS